MEVFIAIALGLACCCTTFTYLFAIKTTHVPFLGRVGLRRRRNPDAKTPPHSLSPSTAEKRDRSINNLWEEADYRNVYPPSRRFALQVVAPQTFSGKAFLAGGLLQRPNAKHTPLLTPFNEMDSGALSPTEITIEEIKVLGDFPDYAALSGVPLPQPYNEFDIMKALPRPYRPFRWAYHQTMSLTKLEPDWWLELENTYVERIKERQELFAQHGKSVLDALPGSEHACKELMEVCIQFLCARYPHYFRLDREDLVFYNDILGTKAHLRTAQPLHVILNNIPEDFALMMRDPETGFYLFRAGVICSSIGWNLGTKLGKRLHEIHAPIPDYKEKMRISMDRYFAKKPTDKPIQRGSWGLEIDSPLYMPPGDARESHRAVQDADLPLSRCNLRVDWQTLRRLPLSGAVVFNFKALFTPVERFRHEPYVPSLLIKILTEGKQEIMRYKGTWHTEHRVLPALREWEKEQRERGIVEKEWKVRTLEESPFFPGWEGMWREEQGF